MRRDTLEAFLRGCGGRFIKTSEGQCWEYQGRRRPTGQLVFRYLWGRRTEAFAFNFAQGRVKPGTAVYGNFHDDRKGGMLDNEGRLVGTIDYTTGRFEVNVEVNDEGATNGA